MNENPLATFLHNALALFRAEEETLGRLDAAAGDGDHGQTMVRGLAAAAAAVDAALAAQQDAPQQDAGLGLGDLLVCAGDAFADASGGASGALFGALFCSAGRKLREFAAPVAGSPGAAEPGAAAPGAILPGAVSPAPVSPAAAAAALEAGAAAVAKLGKAAPGDKTLLDALDPFVRAFAAAAADGADLPTAWRDALPAAQAGAAATAGMVARRGRAARLGERSLGHVDPGAQSVVHLLTAALPGALPGAQQTGQQTGLAAAPI